MARNVTRKQKTSRMDDCNEPQREFSKVKPIAPIPRVAQEMSRLNGGMFDIETAIQDLTKKLHAVIRPVGSNAENGGPVSIVPVQSPLSFDIGEIADRAFEVLGQIRMLTESLDV